MNAHKVVDKSELTDNHTRIITEIDGHEIAIFHIDGEYYGVLNYCVHQGAPLCEGDLTGYMTSGDDECIWEYKKNGEVIKCPWHGWKFDIITGRNILSNDYVVPTYPVEMREDGLYIIFNE